MGISMWICWEGVHYCACPTNFPLLWNATNFHHATIFKCLSLSFICQMPLLLLFFPPALSLYSFHDHSFLKKISLFFKIMEFFLNSFFGKTESACNAGDLSLIPGLGRSPGERKDYPLQYSGLENSMDYSPWGLKELDMTERLSLHFTSVGGRGSVYPRGFCGCRLVGSVNLDGKNFFLFFGWEKFWSWFFSSAGNTAHVSYTFVTSGN